MLYEQMTPEQLLAEYNRLEKMLYGAEYADIPEGEFDKIEGWLAKAGYGLNQPPQVLSSLRKRQDHTSALHGGTCVECERPAPVLTQEGYCEACVMEAMIQARAW